VINVNVISSPWKKPLNWGFNSNTKLESKGILLTTFLHGLDLFLEFVVLNHHGVHAGVLGF
jgi:hypothetical protein